MKVSKTVEPNIIKISKKVPSRAAKNRPSEDFLAVKISVFIRKKESPFPKCSAKKIQTKMT